MIDWFSLLFQRTHITRVMRFQASENGELRKQYQQ
jgi:hypothetical protein